MSGKSRRHPQFILIGLILALTVVVACSPSRRYRVLSFFFDGVPHPDGTMPEGPKPRKEVSEFSRLKARILAEATPTPIPVVAVSVHEPVRNRQCSLCHDMRSGLNLVARNASLCDQCHAEQRRREGWDHGPINLGTCIPCHRAHESMYPHLLEKPVPEICLECHREDMERERDYHKVEEVDQCMLCHDPHRMY